MFQKNPYIENPILYNCKLCDFITGNKKDYSRHEMTKKHRRNVSLDVSFLPSNAVLSTESSQIDIISDEECKNKFLCKSCNKDCLSRVTLWRHKKKCQNQPLPQIQPLSDESVSGNTTMMKEMLIEVVRQNNQQNAVFIENFTEKFMEKFCEMSKQQSIITNNNNTTNNNTVNNQFNLNFFLNEKCKNAINLVDFINLLQVNVSDLVNTGKVGFVEGITTILLNKLKEYDVYSRPLHCTDSKREIVYVKHQDVWEKENDEKTRNKKLVNNNGKKNLDQITKWAEENPDFMVLDSKAYNEYVQIGMSSTGGTVEQQDKNIDKVVGNIMKAVVIDKQSERLQN